ncbi:uncharacterized protein LOC128182272 [Crassostrea angulata]|uniref:uncharacterized protein LOC128182272 n=1 Tax=Magallana angulata TaxID=2784310 RepID=UPI0022B144DA|nr:uncharacterized protein LOC128182272 [Crassostrea angulata]
MAQYKVHDPDKMIQCPLDKAHVLQAKRMQYHIMDCRKNFKADELATCPLNARHVMLKKDYREHMESCPDRAVVEAMISGETGEESSMFRGCVDLPVYEQVNIPNAENWDDEIPSVPRIGVDPQHLAKQDHMIIPGLTRSQKKKFARQMHFPAENRSYVTHQTKNNEPSKVPLPQQCPPRTTAPTKGSQSMRSNQRSSAVFAYSLSTAGIGRGRSQSGKLLPPPSAVPKLNNGFGKENGRTEDSMEDLNKNLKKIEKKLRQIELLETKVDEGHTLTAEEAEKVGKKEKLTKEREDLLHQKVKSNRG